MLKDKIKSLIASENEKGSKKKIENIVVFIIILVITVIAINSIWTGSESEEEESTEDNISKQLASVETSSDKTTTESTIQKNLESILSNIEGVGKVKVLITYSESSEVIAMYNENNKNSVVEEKDSGRWDKDYY